MNQILQSRIYVIDALRAVTLLGILLTHTAQLFCFDNEYNDLGCLDLDTNPLFHYILVLLSGKCKTIFCILFGISFYFILKNPNYSNKKFIWRCIILICFGLLNKILYTTEILMWYGLCGILLVSFRHLSCRKILYTFICLYLLFLICKFFTIGVFKLPERDFYIRYIISNSLIDIMTYPLQSSILDYLYIMIPYGLIETLSLFLLGYYMGIAGFVNNLQKYVTTNFTIGIGACYIVSAIVYHQSFAPYLLSLNSLIGALAYSVFFIYLYSKINIRLYPLESYGKMGLTNYTLQNICGVILMAQIFIPKEISANKIMIYMLFFYILQMIISSLWMKHYKYGPLEGLWRKVTNIIN